MNEFDLMRKYINDAAKELVTEGLMDFRSNAKRFRRRLDMAWSRFAITIHEYDVIDAWVDAVQGKVDRLEAGDMPRWEHLRLSNESVDLGYGLKFPKESESNDSHVSVPDLREDIRCECCSGGDATDGALPDLSEPVQEGFQDDGSNAGHVEDTVQGCVPGRLSDDREPV